MSIEKFSWIEPLGDEDPLRQWLEQNHADSLDGIHPVYLYMDEEFKEHKIMLVGSTPITHNYLKNFKSQFNEEEKEKTEQDLPQDEPTIASKKVAVEKELYESGYKQGWETLQNVGSRYNLEQLEEVVRSHELLPTDEDIKKSFEQKTEQVSGSAEKQEDFRLGLMRGFVDAAYKQFIRVGE